MDSCKRRAISKAHFIEVFAGSGVQSAAGRAGINCRSIFSRQYHIMLWFAKSLSFCAGVMNLHRRQFVSFVNLTVCRRQGTFVL